MRSDFSLATEMKIEHYYTACEKAHLPSSSFLHPFFFLSLFLAPARPVVSGNDTGRRIYGRFRMCGRFPITYVFYIEKTHCWIDDVNYYFIADYWILIVYLCFVFNSALLFFYFLCNLVIHCKMFPIIE